MFKQLLVSGFALIPTLFMAAPSIHASGCTFGAGFDVVAATIPNQVGGCLTGPVGLGNGDVAQQTTEGQMMWDKANNIVRYISGATTWVLGPFGVQARASDA